MDTLNQIVLLMTKEEQRNFKLLAARSHGAKTRKDVQLFDYIRKSGSRFNERKIQKKLYPEHGKNVYYRLKNRLLGDVAKSIAFLHFEENDTIYTFHNLTLAILYGEKQAYGLAHYFLRKAEKKAIVLEHFDLLDLIYGEYIKLSFEITEINPENFIQKRKKNRAMINRLREIDNILAVVTYRIKVTQNYSTADTTILELLETTVKEFAAEEDIRESPQLRLRMYEAVSKLLLQQRNYAAMEEYLLNTYREFQQDKLFNKSTHYTKLEMLTYIVNTLVRNERFLDALSYAKELNAAMLEFNKMYFDRFLFFYYNALATSYLNTDLEKATALLTDMLEDEKITKVPAYEVYTHQNLALAWYQKGDFSKTLKAIVRLQLTVGYQSMDESLKLQIAIFELMVRFDQGDLDTLKYRVNQILQDSKSQFASESYQIEAEFVGILEEMIDTIDLKNDAPFRDKVDVFGANYIPRDSHFLNFSTWLTEKLA